MKKLAQTTSKQQETAQIAQFLDACTMAKLKN
jgi:hypothetical protein